MSLLTRLTCRQLHIVLVKHCIVYQIALEVGSHNCTLGRRSNDTYDMSKEMSTNHALPLYQNASTTETLLDSSTNQNQRRFHKGPITFHKGS